MIPINRKISEVTTKPISISKERAGTATLHVEGPRCSVSFYLDDGQYNY